MLSRIAITNLATIQSLAIDWEQGFTVLTGETGAGKSILIEALRFVLGAKASADQIRSAAPQATVEAVFDLNGSPGARGILEDLEIPGGEELVVRRTMQPNGRSRAVANDCAITQQKLEELGTYLVNIHGQHDNQMLLDPKTHIDFLDAFANSETLRAQVAEAYRNYTQLVRERKTLQEQSTTTESRRGQLKEEISDLTEAALSPSEEEALWQEHTVLTNGEDLIRLTGSIREELYEGENAIVARLASQEGLLSQAAALDVSLRPLLEQLRPLRHALDDVYRSLSAYTARLEADPARQEAVNERLALLEKIKRRFGGSITTAISQLAEKESELDSLHHDHQRLENLGEEIAQVAAGLHDLAEKLTQRRVQTAANLDQLILEQLRDLGMEKAAFKTSIRPLFAQDGKTPLHTPLGKEEVEFMLTTNPGQDLRPLSKIASGGELSRTMLAMKTILARTDPARTLIFDEVDAGIGGALAEKVGLKLRALGGSHQVLCVTHLPQIAALSGNHLLVTKEMEQEETFTRVERLSEKQQVQEVARLMSGLKMSGHTLASAEEMVARGRQATS